MSSEYKICVKKVRGKIRLYTDAQGYFYRRLTATQKNNLTKIRQPTTVQTITRQDFADYMKLKTLLDKSEQRKIMNIKFAIPKKIAKIIKILNKKHKKTFTREQYLTQTMQRPKNVKTTMADYSNRFEREIEQITKN